MAVVSLLPDDDARAAAACRKRLPAKATDGGRPERRLSTGFGLVLRAASAASTFFPEPLPSSSTRPAVFLSSSPSWLAAAAASTFFPNRCRRGSTKTAVFLSSSPRGLLRQQHPPFFLNRCRRVQPGPRFFFRLHLRGLLRQQQPPFCITKTTR